MKPKHHSITSSRFILFPLLEESISMKDMSSYT